MSDFDIDAAQQLCDNYARSLDRDYIPRMVDALPDALTEIRRLRHEIGVREDSLEDWAEGGRKAREEIERLRAQVQRVEARTLTDAEKAVGALSVSCSPSNPRSIESGGYNAGVEDAVRLLRSKRSGGEQG